MKNHQNKRKQLQQNLAKPATKGDLEEMAAYIVSAIAKTLEEYPTKDDLTATEKHLEFKIDQVAGDVSDIRRRVRDLETDTITRREFNDFKGKIVAQ